VTKFPIDKEYLEVFTESAIAEAETRQSCPGAAGFPRAVHLQAQAVCPPLSLRLKWGTLSPFVALTPVEGDAFAQNRLSFGRFICAVISLYRYNFHLIRSRFPQ
jgi:hypothetical protein